MEEDYERAEELYEAAQNNYDAAGIQHAQLRRELDHAFTHLKELESRQVPGVFNPLLYNSIWEAKTKHFELYQQVLAGAKNLEAKERLLAEAKAAARFAYNKLAYNTYNHYDAQSRWESAEEKEYARQEEERCKRQQEERFKRRQEDRKQRREKHEEQKRHRQRSQRDGPASNAKLSAIDPKAIEQWHADIDLAFSNYASINFFPKPPAMLRGQVRCAASQGAGSGGRILAACECNIRSAFSGMSAEQLKKERLRFHPDKFSKCQEGSRAAFQKMAQEVFVVVDALYQARKLQVKERINLD